jgi:hypothetical protein
MTLAGFFAPGSSRGGGFHLSSSTLIIVAIVVVLGGLAIWGFRASDRSPGSDDKAQRDRIED